jgi:quercetin dioxygenase-like cupin family protein
MAMDGSGEAGIVIASRVTWVRLSFIKRISAQGESMNALKSGAPGMEVVTSIVEFKPGETIPRHSHHGVESAYVIQGATLQAPGKPSRTVPTGANLQNLRDAVHGGDKIIGNTSFKLFTVHIVDKGKPLFEPAAK